MSTTTKIVKRKLREALHQEKSSSFKKRTRRAEDAAMKDMDDKKLSTKLKKAYTKADRAVEDFMDETNLSELDTKAGEAVDYVADKAKKTGEFIANKSRAVANTGRWIKKHPVKTGLGTAAVAGGAVAMSSDDDDLSSEIKKIKAKDPSERTAAEKRLLRIMEED